MLRSYQDFYDYYLGSDHEDTMFKNWYEESAEDLDLEELTDESYHDLMAEFRDTQAWTDYFLDWKADR